MFVFFAARPSAGTATLMNNSIEIGPARSGPSLKQANCEPAQPPSDFEPLRFICILRSVLKRNNSSKTLRNRIESSSKSARTISTEFLRRLLWGGGHLAGCKYLQIITYVNIWFWNIPFRTSQNYISSFCFQELFRHNYFMLVHIAKIYCLNYFS